MAPSSKLMLDQVFAIDIGATSIKFCHVDQSSTLRGTIRRRATPYPCTPTALVRLLNERIARTQCVRVGVGFPGVIAEGRVVWPGNLSRPGGVTTDIDPVLHAQWVDFALGENLATITGRDVRVVNDATLAALGSYEGRGTEVVFTLGTGFGLALVVNGALQRVRDVGAEIFLGGRTYDQLLGERSRGEDEAAWRSYLERAIVNFSREFDATTVHLAGGNARRISPDGLTTVTSRVVINGNEAPLRGAAKLFYD